MQSHRGSADDRGILSGFDVSQNAKHSESSVVYWDSSISNYFQNAQCLVTLFLWEVQSDTVFEEGLLFYKVIGLKWNQEIWYKSSDQQKLNNLKILRNNFFNYV